MSPREMVEGAFVERLIVTGRKSLGLEFVAYHFA